MNHSEIKELKDILNDRFNKNMHRHEGIVWEEIATKIEQKPEKIWSLYEMERTGGEPDVIGFDRNTQEFLFIDCSKETPLGRRNVCYDREAQISRKEHKPQSNAIDMAKSMGIELLTEEEYRFLQRHEHVDTKTSSWLKTPEDIRKLDGAIFGDFRYGKVFIYHNGAQSYYAVRGFRGSLRI
jgi:hypothetical protein